MKLRKMPILDLSRLCPACQRLLTTMLTRLAAVRGHAQSFQDVTTLGRVDRAEQHLYLGVSDANCKEWCPHRAGYTFDLDTTVDLIRGVSE
jgi:hypothetical protein